METAQDQFFDRIVDSLASRGALNPVPGSERHPIPFFHSEPRPPAAVPMVRHYRALKILKQHGLNGENAQKFFGWQLRTFFLGIHIYMPKEEIAQWMRIQAPQIAREPLPQNFQELARLHIAKIVGPAIGKENNSFPVAKSLEPNDKPKDGPQKESRGDLLVARPVLSQHPHVLHSAVVFQGLQLQFLDNMMKAVDRHPTLAGRERAVYSEAIERIGINFANANFVRLPIWTAIAHYRRTNGNVADPITVEDFSNGWKMIQEGGGFATKIPNKSHPDQPGSEVKCPFHQPGRRAAATEICRREQNGGTGPKPEHEAYGLWCIHNALKAASTVNSGPHVDDLRAIAENLKTPQLDTHPYFTIPRDPRGNFRDQLFTAHTAIVNRLSPSDQLAAG